MITVEARPSCGALEGLFFERVARAERLLETQRLRVRELEDRGFDIAQPRALLKLMEAVTEQFRTALRLLRAYQAPPPVQLGTLAAPAELPAAESPPGPLPAHLTSRLPARELATTPCSHCGLVLAVNPDGAFTYEMGQWLRQCRYPLLASPTLCQLIPSSSDVVH